ncbi:alpha-L RNA-binding motif-containing protein [Thozetella sp. PMI_491]|nr:alpha-L RNA-binding motif-containing protein [Thozetella sp. PMI_491]
MKQRRLLRFHGLKRPRVRQTWNKYNLYNLARLRTPNSTNQTFYQQKWSAKSLARGYHGEHVRENMWKRMFSRRLLSVVDMDPAYLAKYDGSEQALGRGSGREGDQVKNHGTKRETTFTRGGAPAMTPYTQMTFAPMERRLDIAIFRALFASSARQARQFILHGFVKVNGIKMVHSGYLLNPGDLFQVEVEKVLLATGRPRPSPNSSSAKDSDAAVEEKDEAEVEAQADPEASENTKEAEPAKAAVEEEPEDEATAKERQLERLKAIFGQAKEVLDISKTALPAKRKQEIRALRQNIKKEMSRSNRRDASVEDTRSTVDELVMLMSELELKATEARKDAKTGSKAKKAASEMYQFNAEELARLRADKHIKAYDDARDNPVDKSKPYLTPWQPRPFMAPFAFIPPYLEVNQNICSAVYLRHPVARLGGAEVPTPFASALSQLAFNWYLRRR